MTNTRSIAGAAAWMMVTLTLAFAALAPVEAASPCEQPKMMVGQVCTNLVTGAAASGCKPILA